MDDTQRMTQLATRAKIARMNGDDDEGDRLAAEAIRISDLATLRAAGIDAEQDKTRGVVRLLSGLTDAEIDEVGGMPFDVLKGHPDHSGLSHA